MTSFITAAGGKDFAPVSAQLKVERLLEHALTLAQVAALCDESPALESLGQDAKLELLKPLFAQIGSSSS